VERGLRYPDYFREKYGFWPPPSWAELSDYDPLLDAFIEQHLFELDGDIVEIGAFIGGGTYKLSMLMERYAPEKKIIVLDIFDPAFDTTSRVTDSRSMAEIYSYHLHGRTQEELFTIVTRGCTNLIVVRGDSMEVQLPTDHVCFAYIDGCHSPEYIRHDFHLVWPKAVPGSLIAFDDYGFDLPAVTRTVDELLAERKSEICRTWLQPPKTIFLQKADSTKSSDVG
jgi:hypothetical protein